MLAGKYDFAKEILKRKNCDPNINNRTTGATPLHLSVMGANVEMTRLLLRSGADLNAKNKDGNTAAHIAALQSIGVEDSENDKKMTVEKMRDIMELLLTYDNINIEMENLEGLTPLGVAAAKGSEEVVRLLLNKGACLITEETSWPYFGVKLSCVCPMFAYRKKSNDH